MIDEENLSEFIRTRLKKYREQSGYTVNGLAYKSGISQSYISNIETGKKRNLSVLKLYELCLELDITLCEFFNEDFVPASVDPLVNIIHSLNAEQKEKLLAFLTSMKM